LKLRHQLFATTSSSSSSSSLHHRRYQRHRRNQQTPPRSVGFSRSKVCTFCVLIT
jgi:hypothetical protein